METFKKWLIGLVSVCISSAAGMIPVLILDPKTFNLSTGLSNLGKVCLVTAMIHAALYLKQSPLPGQRIDDNKPSQ